MKETLQPLLLLHLLLVDQYPTSGSRYQLTLEQVGSNINGANAASYVTPATVYPTTPAEQFRCVLTNANATTLTSSAATLTVNESEFVSGPATVTPVIDADTNRTFSRQPLVNTTPFIVEYANLLTF